MRKDRHIFLVGFMGCGKSSWGAVLAQRLGLPFVDLDRLVEEQVQKSIAEIFEEVGEAGFRKLEWECLSGLAGEKPSVVATGGGTPCFFDNMEWMNANGTTLYLRAPVELLVERLWPERGRRPLIAGLSRPDLEAFVRLKLAEREGYYLQAALTVDVGEGA